MSEAASSKLSPRARRAILVMLVVAAVAISTSLLVGQIIMGK